MAAAGSMDAVEARAIVARIVKSRAFTSSERMGRLLRFLVEQSIAGQAEQLKEYQLGVDVFDRGADFDPRIDPIVRVEMRRLRSKLAAYYEAEGREELIRLEIPTGAYVPRLVARSSLDPVPPDAPPATHMVVLPFSNLSSDPETDYFSDGLTEELIHALARADGLRVVAWGTASRLKERREQWAAIASELKVGTILQGSVRRAGDRLRILVNLVEAQSGFYLWSETYDRTMADWFAIQEEIAQSVAESLKARLLKPAAPHPVQGANDLTAYDLYLRGRFHWHKRTTESFERAIGYFQEALTRQPDFAPAFAGLADVLTLSAQHTFREPAEAMPKARKAAQRALEINPQSAEAYASLALIEAVYDWDWVQAGEHFRQAIGLQPGYATAHHWYGVDYLANLARFDEAVASMQRAIHLDPLNPAMQDSLGYVLVLARRYDEALGVQLELLDLDTNNYKAFAALGRIYIQQGLFDRAADALGRAHFLAGDLPGILAALVQAQALLGRQEEAEGIADRLLYPSGSRYVPHASQSIACLGLGERARALELLEKALACRESALVALAVHPVYDPLRTEPRFQDILRRIGLERVTST
jgi:serine/threonine-protein kinase